MLEYMLNVFNEIVNFNRFQIYVLTNLSFINEDNIVICYFIFLILVFMISIVVIIFLVYFIKYCRNTWIGRKRY